MKAQDIVQYDDPPFKVLPHKSSGGAPTIIDVLSPPYPSPDWPDSRTYEDIAKLHAKNTEQMAMTDKLCVYDFAEEIVDGATVIDIGAGKGVLISNLRQIAQTKGIRLNLVAVSVTELDLQLATNADSIYYQKVPDNDELLRDYANKADFVIDTFGAATYATNPIHALIYSLLLLKPGGKYTAISSLIPGHEIYSAFGDKNTQAALIEFIKEYLDLELSIKPTYLKSKVIGNEGKIMHDLLIKCECSLHSKKEFSLDQFKKLVELVDKKIGLPEVVSIWNHADFGKFQIREIRYNKALELNKLKESTELEKGQSEKMTALGVFAHKITAASPRANLSIACANEASGDIDHSASTEYT